MNAPDYGRAFALMRDQAPQWEAYMRHPFVEGLRDGSLPKECFLHYLAQDYVYLIHYARAWALGVVKAETLEEMRACSGVAHNLIAEEMQLHVGVCGEAGISQQELAQTPERPENMAYTRYVLEAGFSGDFLDLLAALAPCVFGYAEIGLRLAEEKSSETYSQWIGTYADEGFQQACRDVGALLDAALEARLGVAFETSPRWQALCHKFNQATELEVGFWQMGITP